MSKRVAIFLKKRTEWIAQLDYRGRCTFLHSRHSVGLMTYWSGHSPVTPFCTDDRKLCFLHLTQKTLLGSSLRSVTKCILEFLAGHGSTPPSVFSKGLCSQIDLSAGLLGRHLDGWYATVIPDNVSADTWSQKVQIQGRGRTEENKPCLQTLNANRPSLESKS